MMDSTDAIIHCAGREFELMCLAARVDFDEETASNCARLMHAGIDWPAFLAKVERNYIAPLVYRNLKSTSAPVAPKVLDTLRVRSKLTAFKSEQFATTLTHLSQLLESKGIRTIHYKGAVTAHEFYGSVTARNFNDLDFLVRREDLRSIVQLLDDEGYANSEQLTPAQFDHYVREFKEFLFQRGEICLEPHWSLAGRRYRFDADYEGFWQRSRILPFRGAELRVMSMEDSLLVLCLVGAKGRWKRLQMITDVAACAGRCNQQDWEKVTQRAMTTGTLRILHLGLRLAAELSGAKLPAPVESAVRRAPVVRRLARQVALTLAGERRPAKFLPASPSLFSPLLFRQRERFGDRWNYLWHTTTTPDLYHLRRLPLPQLAHPLYRLIVPLHDFVVYPILQMVRALLART